MQCAKYPNCAKFCAVYWSLFTLIQLFFSLYVESKIKCAVNTLQFTKCAVDINVWFGRSLKQSNVWWTVCTERWTLCTGLCQSLQFKCVVKTSSDWFTVHWLVCVWWSSCGGLKPVEGEWRSRSRIYITSDWTIWSFRFVSAGKYPLFLDVWWIKILENRAA